MSLELVPMEAADYDAWLAITVPAYAAEKAANGSWPEAEAVQRAQDSLAGLLPQGRTTPGHFLHTLVAEPGIARVGYLWFGRREAAAYLYDIYIHPQYRRRGYGRQAMQALERAAIALGCTTLSLHVFGRNHAAAALYRTPGYEVTDLNLSKALPAR